MVTTEPTPVGAAGGGQGNNNATEPQGAARIERTARREFASLVIDREGDVAR
jgi:hypothetical protein